MVRTARVKSNTGIYHIMLRGIDKRDIFLKEKDYVKFIECIKKARQKREFKLYAFCLMTNHVHLLLKTEEEAIGDVLRRITVGYVQYHNIKHGRTGHLFQNRFKSEPIETDEYFLVVMRYIHQNPVKAGMVSKIKDYKWSSYSEYIKKSTLIDTQFALGYFEDLRDFKIFNEEKTDDQCLEYDAKIRYSDEGLKQEISLFADIDKLFDIDTTTRNHMIKNIKDQTGASNRQLARVLNIGRGVLDRIT